MTLTMLILAGAVILRSILLSPQLNHHRWDGHQWQFAALCASHACMCAGAVAIAVGYQLGGPTLLFGVAAEVLFERRRNDRRTHR